MGCRVEFITAERHDRIAAKVSHLPHVVSTALLAVMMRGGKHRDLRFGGPGLASMIRIAGANPEMWVDIFDSNRKCVRKELTQFIRQLQQFDRVLARKDTGHLLRLLMSTHRLKQVHR